MMTTNQKTAFRLTAIIAAIMFVTYNAVLFAICGFPHHGGAFWLSYVFMMVAFATFAISGFIVKDRVVQPKDWLLGYPILKHCVIYLVVELIVSVLFIILDAVVNCPWGIAFAVQLILLAVHLVFIISCFVAKEIIEGVGEKTEKKTSYVALLRVDVEMIAERQTDPDLKKEFAKLAEQVRFSDPMSSDLLGDLERNISALVDRAKVETDAAALMELCREISLLLTERNKKCKVLK